ncbi:MAG: hypothetical protein ACRD27_03825 [Terracidiphilus sp.]
MDAIEKNLNSLNNSVSVLQTQHYAEVFREGAHASPQEIGESAVQLRKQGTVLPRQLVAKAAAALVHQSEGSVSGASWGALRNVLGYISFLNKPLIPNLAPFHGPNTFIYKPHSWNGKIRWLGASNYPDVPQFHPIGFGYESNQDIHAGPALLVLSGGASQSTVM